jgi:hypothetical protein
MISAFLSLVLLFAGPFWESKPPAEWTDVELTALLTSSPWAQVMDSPAKAVPGPGVSAYLATASAMVAAEKEADRRVKIRRKPGTEPEESPLAGEYKEWLEQNRATQIVLAVRMDSNRGFSDDREVQRMEDESVMRAGKHKFKITGHFPPYQGDPYLRLAFPRQVDLSDKTLNFDLYLPGVPVPYRSAEFKLKDMLVDGKLDL